MIGVDVIYTCDAPGCGESRVVPMDVMTASDRAQYVRIPATALPIDWTLDAAGNLYCPQHRVT